VALQMLNRWEVVACQQHRSADKVPKAMDEDVRMSGAVGGKGQGKMGSLSGQRAAKELTLQ
jgi:hypothetical protein